MHKDVSSPTLQGELHLASSTQRIPELDGLRGFAILLVILCHYVANANHRSLNFFIHRFFQALDFGWSGVDLFFVLSGFLIGGILLESRNSPRFFQTFYLRRVHRILPIYYIWIFGYVVMLLAILFLVRGPVEFLPERAAITASDLSHVPRYLLFVQNMLYSPSRIEWVWFVVVWSLAVEEQFYLVAPPVVRFLPRRALVITLGTTILLAPLLRCISFSYLPQLDHFYQFAMPCRADALSLGILAAMAWRWDFFRFYLAAHPAMLRYVFLCFGLGVIGVFWWLVHPANIIQVTIGYTFLAFFYTAMLLLVLSGASPILTRVFRAGWLRSLGRISYCVYIIHFAINQLAHRILFHAEPQIQDWKGIGTTLLAALLTWTIASISWKYLEKPLVRRGHQFHY